MLHRYRCAMVRPGRERLSGHVEVDEAYVGGVEEKVHGRQTETKAIVAIAVEISHPRGFGRIRLASVPDATKESLLPFVDGAIEPGATVHTDSWQAYLTLPERGYEHERTVMSQQSDPAHVVMPGVHRIASLLTRPAEAPSVRLRFGCAWTRNERRTGRFPQCGCGAVAADRGSSRYVWDRDRRQGPMGLAACGPVHHWARLGRGRSAGSCARQRLG